MSHSVQNFDFSSSVIYDLCALVSPNQTGESALDFNQPYLLHLCRALSVVTSTTLGHHILSKLAPLETLRLQIEPLDCPVNEYAETATPGHYQIDIEGQVITLSLSPSLAMPPLMERHATRVELETGLLIFKALRDFHIEELCSDTGLYTHLTLDNILFFERCREADLYITALAIQMEWMAQGWVQDYKVVLTQFSDPLTTFFTHLTQNHPNPDNRLSLADSFIRWFDHPFYTAIVDRETLEFVDELLVDGLAIFGSAHVDQQLISECFSLPNWCDYTMSLTPDFFNNQRFKHVQDQTNLTHLKHIHQELEGPQIGGYVVRDQALAKKLACFEDAE